MSLINVSNLTFCYEGSHDNIFENVSFCIDTQWRLGLTGRNGRGKTTLLNLLFGKYEYEGTISSSVTFDYFPFEVADKSKNTEEIIEEICADFESWRLNLELEVLEVSQDVLERPFNTLSNGEQAKILLCALFLKQNNFLLIDEPTNHLDLNARKIVSDYLKSKKSYIIVSHDRAFLDNCVDHILAINKTDIEIQKGNFSSWQQNKLQKDNLERQQNEILKGEIKKLSDAARRASDWSNKAEAGKYSTQSSGLKPDRGYIGHKAAKIMKRAKSIEKRKNNAADKKAELLKNIESMESLALKPLEYHKTSLVWAKRLGIYYGDNMIFENIGFEINKGDRAAVRGKNGSGKSSILKLIYGEKIDFIGEFKIGSNLIISYVSQDTSHLKGVLKDFADQNNLDKSLFLSFLIKLDFSRQQFEKDIRDLSEGQKKKVLIAKSLCTRAHLYIWDEPLNFIDVISRMQIEELILKSAPTMLFVEHDQAFCESVATKIINL